LEFIHFEAKCILLNISCHCYAEIVTHLEETFVKNTLKVVIFPQDLAEFIAANDPETVCDNERIKE
jgi:hypothetical protein